MHAYHIPVLLRESVSLLLTATNGVYVDGTLGGGGHAEAILDALDAQGTVLGLDVDEDAVHAATERLARFGQRLTVVQRNFQFLRTVLRENGIPSVNGILLDLGVSSHQFDMPEKGFSFRSDERLDMRMDHTLPTDAYTVVNTYDERRLADIFWKYGEERASRSIARALGQARAGHPVETTGALASVVEHAAGSRFLVKTLARVFQALRIEVNHELESLRQALEDGIDVLQPGGRMAVISYHSLEDRLVKDAFRAASAVSIPSGHKLIPDTPLNARTRIITKKPITASEQEAEENPRARSAKLRVVEKII